MALPCVNYYITLTVSGTETNKMQEPFTLAVHWTRTRHLKPIESHFPVSVEVLCENVCINTVHPGSSLGSSPGYSQCEFSMV